MPPARKRVASSSANKAASTASKRGSSHSSTRDTTAADDAEQVLGKCRELRQRLIKKTATKTTTPVREDIPQNILEVAELPAEHVLEGMESLALRIAHQVMAKQGFTMDIPSRASSNQVYVKEWDRIVLGDKRSSRSFLNVKVRACQRPLHHSHHILVPCSCIVASHSHAVTTILVLQESRKSAITLRVLQLLHAVLMKRIHITKRDLFYTDVKLFVDQSDSDVVLDDVATMIGCTRSNLHVVASDKGLVVGRIQFEEDGDYIDCTKMGVGGKAIPPYIDKIENITSDAEFVLLVEKEAAYMRMAVRVQLCIVILFWAT